MNEKKNMKKKEGLFSPRYQTWALACELVVCTLVELVRLVSWLELAHYTNEHIVLLSSLEIGSS